MSMTSSDSAAPVSSAPPVSNDRATPLLSRSSKVAAKLNERGKKLDARILRVRKKLRLFQNIRLSIAGLFFLVLALLTTKPEWRLELPVIAAFVVVFGFYVARTRRIDRHLNLLRRLRVFCDRQEKRARGLPSGRSFEGAEKAATNLALNHDLGVLGSHSLWTLLDETLTEGGQSRLLEWISQKPLSATDIKKRQSQVRALRRERWFFTRLALVADADDFRLSSSQILKFLKKPFVAGRFNLIVVGTWLIWIAAIVLIVLSLRAGWKLEGLFFVLFAASSLAFLNKAAAPFAKGVGLSHHLSLLAPIFEALENRSQKSEALQQLCPVTSGSGPSRQARKLNVVLAFMSVQANPLVYLIVNAIVPWSLTGTYFLERRRKRIAYTFPQCLEELSELEALASLVIFEYYQTDVYPEVKDAARRPPLAFKMLFHPLIDRERVVPNDFHFPTGKNLGLLTGSNMSGKSTFLRTIGVNQILANIGAPVFAEKFETSPLTIETCIEVSDSLRDGFSYFYAEVRRLKALLETSKHDQAMLYLIDEIFRGTNNRERHIGSRAVIRTLAASPHSIGFISTHDLELTALESSSPTVLNLHFREEISPQGEMLFTYLLRHGPCPTTNALKIMAAEGIEVEDP